MLYATVFVGAASVFVTFVGVVFVKRTLDETRNASTAAFEAVKVTRQTAERQLRAYIFQEIKFDERADNNLVPHARVILHNYGQTPAHDVLAWVGIGVFEVPLVNPLPNMKTENVTPSVIGPNSTGPDLLVTMGQPLPDTFIEDVKQKGIGLYIWGEIEYMDAYKNSRQTGFRYVLGKDTIDSNRIAICKEGNYAT